MEWLNKGFKDMHQEKRVGNWVATCKNCGSAAFYDEGAEGYFCSKCNNTSAK